MVSVFSSVLQPDQITNAKADLTFYGKDASHHYEAHPAMVIFPRSTEQVQACVRIAAEQNLKLVPSGGRTGYSGGATASQNEVILSLERMNKVISTSIVDATIRVQAGVTLERVQQTALEAGLYYPIDFTTRGSAQIGGTIATNAGGIRVIRYGMTRDWVLGLQVVTPQGECLELNGALYKNNSGYNLTQLFCGSEGTLGIITEATLRLTTPPTDSVLIGLALDNEHSIPTILGLTRKAGYQISLFEFMDSDCMDIVLQHHAIPQPFQHKPAAALLIEIDTNPSKDIDQFFMELLEEGLCIDIIKAESLQQRQHLMQLRDFIGDVINKQYTVHKQDVSVALKDIPAFLQQARLICHSLPYGIRAVFFGHAGDGNIHINVLNGTELTPGDFFKECEKIDETLFSLVASFNGSISAEHGVGMLKKHALHFCRSENELQIMRSIKSIIDPLNIFNPNKIIDL